MTKSLLASLLVLASCGPVGPKPPDPTGPGTLSMRAEFNYGPCNTCTHHTTPAHCWTGRWISGTSAAAGQPSFGNKCQPAEDVLGYPLDGVVKVTTTVMDLKPGRWEITLGAPTKGTIVCPVDIPEGRMKSMWVDINNSCGTL